MAMCWIENLAVMASHHSLGNQHRIRTYLLQYIEYSLITFAITTDHKLLESLSIVLHGYVGSAATQENFVENFSRLLPIIG
jgi:hypothetical protein